MRGVVGLLAFAAAAVASATVAGLLVGSITPGVAATSLAVGLAVGMGAARACAAEAGEARAEASPLWRAAEAAALAVFTLATLRQFLWLAVSDGGSVSQFNPYNYGDLPLHWTYVNFLAEGARFWPDNPVLAGARLGYPIGADLLAALFVTLGASHRARLSGERRAGFSRALRGPPPMGRLAGRGRRSSSPAASLASRLHGGQFLRPSDSDLAWLNVLLALFVPQRGFLYAFPAGLLLLWSGRESLLRGRSGLPPAVFGLLWGALPLFHVHTFLVVSLVLAVWALGMGRLRLLRPALAVALPLGTFAAYQVTGGFAAARLVWWKPGWMIGGGDPLTFLLVNFGLVVHLAWLAFLFPPRAAERESRFILGTALVIFGLLFFVMLAPWEWDNTKALVWCVLLMLGPLPAWLAERRTWLRVLLVALVLLPGVPAALGGLLASKALIVYTEEEKAAVCGMLRAVPVGARVATAQAFEHPVALCGRALVAGYPGHLWSHGLHARPVEERLQRLMLGEPGWEDAARELGAGFVFWGPREAQAFPGSRHPWASDAGRMAWSSAGSLYRLSE